MLSNCDLVSNVSPLLIFCRYQMKCKSVSNVSPRYSMHKIASTSGLMASCRQALALPAEEMPPADVIFERMATDVHLREAVNDWARYLSRGVYSVISMFDPGVVLIGGGISEQEKLYPLLTRHLETFEMWEALQVPIQPCQLGNQAGRLGAVWLAQQKLDRS